LSHDRDHRFTLPSPRGLPLVIYRVLSFLIIIALIAAGVYLVVDLARLPGEIAAQRGHPHADAVRA
jgi:hypothetical protein